MQLVAPSWENGRVVGVQLKTTTVHLH